MDTKSSEAVSPLLALSNDLADAVERAGRSVVAVNARPRTPSSGVYWREGVVVTADHTVKRDEEISITFPDGRAAPATGLTGTTPRRRGRRDPRSRRPPACTARRQPRAHDTPNASR